MPRAPVELCNVEGRAMLLRDGRILDIERRSGGKFGADPMAAIARWDELCAWARTQSPAESDPMLDPVLLGPCVPRPSQVFAIGLNYRDHAKEAGLQEPKEPMVFTKFPSCLAGARASVPLASEHVDWEIELVVVIGKRAEHVSEAQALSHVAGYCVGQDLSDRRVQFKDVPPQFSLAKSAPNFGPIGPALVDASSVDAQNLALYCDVNGTRMQNGSTREMIYPVATLVAYLSQHCTLLPGDLIFTGTPSGVGSVRTPRQYLKPGDLIRSEIVGLGVLENRCVGARIAAPRSDVCVRT